MVTLRCPARRRAHPRDSRFAMWQPPDCMGLEEDLERIAGAAAAHGQVTGVLAAEPASSLRRYLVAFGDEGRRWLGLDDAGAVVTGRGEGRRNAAIVARCAPPAGLAGGGA